MQANIEGGFGSPLSEKSKYELIWTHKGYRQNSPGENIAERVCSRWDKGTVNDYGSGTGRACKVFHQRGFEPNQIDCAQNASEVEYPFFETYLWDLHDVPESDYGFCVDVLEHLPTEKINDVLEGIRRRTKKEVYFQVAHFEDKFNGFDCHLTVKDSDWWRSTLGNMFEIIDEDTDLPLDRTGFYCKPWMRLEVRTHDNVPFDDIIRNIEHTKTLGLPDVESLLFGNIPVAIVGGAPSLNETWVALKTFPGPIVALNNTHDWLIERGIIPYAQVICDAREHNIKFVQNPREDVLYLMSSKCHPKVFEALQGFDVKVWHEKMKGYVHSGHEVPGGSTVGLRALCLFYMFGSIHFHLFGMDSSYRDTHHAYDQPQNDGENVIDVICKGKTYRAAVWMADQVYGLKETLRLNPEMKVYIHGDGLMKDFFTPEVKS